MQPHHLDPLPHHSHGRDSLPDPRVQHLQQSRESRVLSRSASNARLRASDDSWIEISSQPSSSSLSSATDEIVTTGLRVQHEPNGHRRRRLSRVTATNINIATRHTVDSSQDEYEESESESDRILSSSTEEVTAHPRSAAAILPPASASDGAESDDEDDNSTALGARGSTPQFRPQPNAFSHPPMSRSNTSPTVTRPGTRPSSHRNSYSGQRSRQHTPYNMISPSYQADHDAALRASLSTLLSCAAAARGRPKHGEPSTPARNSNAIEPSTLRLVPESVAMGEEPAFNPSIPPQNRQLQQPRSSSGTSPSISVPVSPSPNQHQPARPASPNSKTKRKANPSAAANANNRDRQPQQLSKKSRRVLTVEETVSPTLMTWVISAGVVVLFSAISFSAGYALGREVGKTEAGMLGTAGIGSNGGNESMAACGREAMMRGLVGGSGGGGGGVSGLRRLRWGAGGTGSVTV